MSTVLEFDSGVRAIHITVPTVYDSLNPTDVREDFAGAIIWVSTTSGFLTAEPLAIGVQKYEFGWGNAFVIQEFDGAELTANTEYFIKYSLISAIDPTAVAAIQVETSCFTLPENTSVYGYLTNDPVGLASGPTGIVEEATFTDNAKGIFKVFKYDEDVTGLGVVYSVKPGSAVGGLTSTINPTTGAYAATALTANTGNITFLAEYDGITIEKVWSVFKGVAGAKGFTLSYSNTSHAVPVSNTGVETWTGSGGVLQIYEGTTLLGFNSNTQTAVAPASSGWYNINLVAQSGDTLTEPTLQGQGTNTCTLSNWAGNLTQVTTYRLTAYIKDSTGTAVSLSADIQLTPSVQGETVTLYNIYTSAPVITKEAPDASTSGTHSSVTIYGQQTVGSVTSTYGWISVQPNGQAEGARQNTAVTLSPAQSDGRSNYTIRLYPASTGGAALDTQVLNVVYKGTTGANGANAVYIDLLSESDVVSANEDGTGYSTIPANDIRVFQGGVEVAATSYGVTGTPGTQTQTINGLIATVTVGTGAIAWQGTWTGDTATFTFNAVYAGVTYTTSYTVSKSKTGSTGANGADGANAVYIDLLSESDVVSANEDGTGYSTIPANDIRVFQGGVEVAATSYGVTGTPGTQTQTINGLIATVTVGTGAIAWQGTWTGDTATFTFNAVYAGVTYTTSYTVSKSKKGSSAVYIDLLSESDVVSANTDGTGYATIPANDIRIFKGGVEVTATSYGVTATPGTQTQTINGLIATVTVGTGAIAWQGTWTGDTATFTFNAVYAGVTYTTSYTVSKSKTGATGNTGGTGAPGSRSTVIGLYAWGYSTPSLPTGTSQYAWTGGTHSYQLTDWYVTPPSDTNPGKKLYYVEQTIVDSTGIAGSTTGVSWAGKTIINLSSNAGNAYVCYSKFTGTSAAPTGTVNTAVGQYPTINPSALPTGSSFGITWLTAFTATPPTLSAGETLWISDGYTNLTTGQITWNTPYLQTFKVGSLSAFSVGTGSLQVDGALTIGTAGHIKGGKTSYSDTASGFFLGYDQGATAGYKLNISRASITGISANITSNTFTKTNHGLTNGQVILFTSISTITGISTNIPYFIINAATNTFQVSLYGIQAVDLTGSDSTTIQIAESQVNWDATQLKLTSQLIEGSIFRTASTGGRIEVGTNKGIVIYNSSNVVSGSWNHNGDGVLFIDTPATMQGNAGLEVQVQQGKSVSCCYFANNGSGTAIDAVSDSGITITADSQTNNAIKATTSSTTNAVLDINNLLSAGIALNATGISIFNAKSGQPALKLTGVTSGGGIQFPSTNIASSDPNTLDDYKEATWTPTLTGTSTGIAVASGSTAQYTKIGRSIQFSIALQFTATGTGQIQFTLPTTAASNFAFSVFTANTVAGMSGHVIAWVDSGTSTVTISYLNLTTGTVPTDMATKVKSGTDIRVSGTYW